MGPSVRCQTVFKSLLVSVCALSNCFQVRCQTVFKSLLVSVCVLSNCFQVANRLRLCVVKLFSSRYSSPSVRCQTVFKSLLLLQFFSDSHETWHTWSMCQCAKN